MKTNQQWVADQGTAFAQYKQNIEDNQVDGESFVHDLISVDHWAGLGISNTLHKFILARKREQLLSTAPALLNTSLRMSDTIPLFSGDKFNKCEERIDLTYENANDSIRNTATDADADADEAASFKQPSQQQKNIKIKSKG